MTKSKLKSNGKSECDTIEGEGTIRRKKKKKLTITFQIEHRGQITAHAVIAVHVGVHVWLINRRKPRR